VDVVYQRVAGLDQHQKTIDFRGSCREIGVQNVAVKDADFPKSPAPYHPVALEG